MTNPPVPATPLDVEACSLCGRPLTWNESDTLKAWVCHNCPGTPSARAAQPQETSDDAE